MKRLLILVFLAMATCGIAAAQTAPNGPGAAPPGPRFSPPSDAQRRAMRDAMTKIHTQMAQIHTQTRTQMLAALSPAHRAQLATIVGTLATSTTPDRRAAAKRLDSMLSSTEKQKIVSLANTERTQMRSTMQAARSQMEANMPPEMKARMEQRRAQGSKQQGQRPRRERRTPTAGSILLRTALASNAPGGFGGRPGGGQFGPPQQRPPM
jgi:hypothetical protein